MRKHHFIEERPVHAVDFYMEPSSEIMDSDNVSDGFSNISSINHQISVHNTLDYSNNQHSPELSEYNRGSAQVHFHTDSGAIHASLPDGTNYLHQLHIDMTLGQTIQMCGGQWDIPDPMHNQMGRAECLVNFGAPSPSYTAPRSSNPETCELAPNGTVPFRSDTIVKTGRPKHEIFRDGGRTKVRCHGDRCRGRVLMKENYARHVRERHFGEKRKTGGHHRRRVVHPRASRDDRPPMIS